MENKKKRQGVEIAKELWADHKTITKLTIGSVLIIAAYQLSYESPEIFNGAERIFNLLFVLSGGFIINFIFFYFQVFIPNRNLKLASYEFVKYHLVDVNNCISKILNIFNYFVNVDDEFNKMVMKKKVSYYIETKKYSAYETFDFKEDMRFLKKMVELDLDYILDQYYFQFCDTNIVKQINILKANSFFYLFLSQIRSKDENEDELVVMNLKNELNELNSIYFELSAFIEDNGLTAFKEPYIREFNDIEEKDFKRRCEVLKITDVDETMSYKPKFIINTY